MVAVAHCVEPEHGGVVCGRDDRVGVEVAQHCLAASAESAWEISDFVRPEHAQRGVEVVVARVDKLERDDRKTERLACFGVCGRVGAKAGAGKQPTAGDEQIAFTFVDELRIVGLEAGGTEPVQVGRALSRALRVRNFAPYTRLLATVAPFAANTMSGKPSTGSIWETS